LYFDKSNFKSFFVKRITRILPLLGVVSIAAIILSKKVPDILDLFLNLTGLFGFFKWDTYFATGAWSIGNELVFYAFFPFLLIAVRMKNFFFWFIGVLILSVSIYFSYIVLPNSEVNAEL